MSRAHIFAKLGQLREAKNNNTRRDWKENSTLKIRCSPRWLWAIPVQTTGRRSWSLSGLGFRGHRSAPLRHPRDLQFPPARQWVQQLLPTMFELAFCCHVSFIIVVVRATNVTLANTFLKLKTFFFFLLTGYYDLSRRIMGSNPHRRWQHLSTHKISVNVYLYHLDLATARW